MLYRWAEDKNDFFCFCFVNCRSFNDLSRDDDADDHRSGEASAENGGVSAELTGPFDDSRLDEALELLVRALIGDRAAPDGLQRMSLGMIALEGREDRAYHSLV